MNYVKEGFFKGGTATIAELMEVLRDCPDDYDVYIKHQDSIYAVQDVACDELEENSVSIASRETHGDLSACRFNALSFRRYLEDGECKCSDLVYAEKPDDIDGTLNNQMEEPYGIKKWGVSDICEDIYLITGLPYGWC